MPTAIVNEPEIPDSSLVEEPQQMTVETFEVGREKARTDYEAGNVRWEK